MITRDTCPFCGKPTRNNDYSVVNGRGVFRTKVKFHKACYNKYVKDKKNGEEK